MIKTDRYNNLPDSILNSVPKMKPVEVFELPEITFSQNGRPNIPIAVGIPPEDRIVDPETGRTHEIANIVKLRQNGEPDLDMPVFRWESVGKITLYANKAADRDLFEYLWLSNHNGSNPNRDKSRSPKYVHVDDLARANEELAKETELDTALNMARTMSEKDLIEYANLVGIKTNRATQLIRIEARRMAKSNPKQFHDHISYLGQMGEYITTVRDALEENIIRFDNRTISWSWADNKVEIYAGTRQANDTEYVKNFAEWLRNDKQGKVRHQAIIEALTKAGE